MYFGIYLHYFYHFADFVSYYHEIGLRSDLVQCCDVDQSGAGSYHAAGWNESVCFAGHQPDSKMTQIIKGVIPFGIIMALEILLLCFFPEIATWLPGIVK